MDLTLAKYIQFLSTPSLRRATLGLPTATQETIGISIHALLAEGDGRCAEHHHHIPISIHALLAEGDRRPCTTSFVW